MFLLAAVFSLVGDNLCYRFDNAPTSAQLNLLSLNFNFDFLHRIHYTTKSNRRQGLLAFYSKYPQFGAVVGVYIDSVLHSAVSGGNLIC